jgi:hypothetical protein
MASRYIKYRDIAAVITAGNGLTVVGESLAGRLSGLVGAPGAPGGTIKAGEARTFKGTDDYSRAFNETYRKETDGKHRNDALIEVSGTLAKPAQEIGPSAVLVATTMLYLDAQQGAAIAKGGQQAKGGQK